MVLPFSPVRSGSGETVPRVLHHMGTDRSLEALSNNPAGGVAVGEVGDGRLVSRQGTGAAARDVVDDRLTSDFSATWDHAHERDDVVGPHDPTFTSRTLIHPSP